jgi:hypothetical protein
MRDDFTIQTKELLAKRVAFHCSNPMCRQVTSGPQVDPLKVINIGVAAHITAASPEGPRYDPSLTPKKRRSPDNGIWLCQTCAKLVDNDSIQYNDVLLRQWKSQAEAAATRELERRGPTVGQTADKLFQISPVQSRGENIYYRSKEGLPEKFQVCLHFNLWTRFKVHIINVDLQYAAKGATPGRPTVVFDGKEAEPIDASYRLQRRTTLDANSVLNVSISREFVCRPYMSEDYGAVTIIFEVYSPKWDGFREIEITGQLAPGGELNNLKMNWCDKTTA